MAATEVASAKVGQQGTGWPWTGRLRAGNPGRDSPGFGDQRYDS